MLLASKGISQSTSRLLVARSSRRLFSSQISGAARSTTSSSRQKLVSPLVGAVVLVGASTAIVHNHAAQQQPTLLDARSPQFGGGDIISAGTPVKEPSTGILFPPICNGFDFAGAGVRSKWGLIKVYAVGTYLDRLAMSAVKQSPDDETLEKALLNPDYPRTIRIVMARGLSVDTFTGAIVEALEPRMNGQDLDKLEEFKKLMPPVDLVKGAEILMTVRGDSLLFKNATGGIGEIRSKVFTTALCDVYYGSDAVSPSHKSAVMEGIRKL